MSRQRLLVDKFTSLPIEVIEDILSRLPPPELSTMAAVGSRLLRVLADSNKMWRKFFPSDYHYFSARAVHRPNGISPKRLYYYLAYHPFFLDHGALIFYGDRESGKNSYVIGSLRLGIPFTNHWFWHYMAGSRFEGVAMLMDRGVLSFECTVECGLLSNNTDYVAYLLFKIAPGGTGFKSVSVPCGFVYVDENVDDLHLEDEDEDEDEAVDVIGQDDITFIYFDVGDDVQEGVKVPHQRDDTWMEVEVACFSVDHERNCNVVITLAGDECRYMRGLILEGMEIRPKVAA